VRIAKANDAGVGDEQIVCRYGLLAALAAASIWGALGIGSARAGTLPGTPAAASAFYANSFEKTPSVAAMTALGRALFLDVSLSESGSIACASCHSPSQAFGPPNDLAVQPGGDGHRSGLRAVPSLMYGQNVPPFTEHYVDDDGDDGIDQGPAGGRTWDGRAQSAHDQARLPLFSPLEMANASVVSVIAKVERASYAEQFRETFGARVFDDPARAFKAILLSLETYQQNPVEFYPYTSKYDAWLRRTATLTRAEARGLAAFNDPAKGNCARCHPSGIRDGAFPQFTDFGYAALGVPRNAAIPANADSQYVDLGLCGPLRTDLTNKKEYCGMFRTPTLRNVATRRTFFHNGVVHSLRDAVRFYAERDTEPERWYGNDLPRAYEANLDREAPFDRHRGEPPALQAADVDDIVAFLNTLTDGYAPVGAGRYTRAVKEPIPP
jgi:cytochrome c peroxidase